MVLRDLFRRSRRTAANDAIVEGDDASEVDAKTVLAVDREIWSYSRAVGGRLLMAVIIAIGAAGSAALGGVSVKMHVVWAPFDAATTLATFGVLGLIVTALQVAVRSSLRAQVDPADGARQQFLSTIAFATMPVVLWLGFYASWVSVLEADRDTFDPIRGYGPLFIALALALIAADAAAGRPFDSSSRIAIEARRKRQRAESRRALRVLSRRTKAPTKTQIIGAVALGSATLTGQMLMFAPLSGSQPWPILVLLAGYLALLLGCVCAVVAG